MQLAHACAQHLFRKVIRRFCRLAVLYMRVRCARESLDKNTNFTDFRLKKKKGGATNLEHGLEGLPKCSLSQAGTWKFRSPQKIWVAEDELDRCSPVNRTRAIDEPSRQDDICHDLDIERPVARVMENEDRGYWRRREINWLQPMLVYMRSKYSRRTLADALSSEVRS
jgi:hypothetical protein